jgi:hypothetical protein
VLGTPFGTPVRLPNTFHVGQAATARVGVWVSRRCWHSVRFRFRDKGGDMSDLRGLLRLLGISAAALLAVGFLISMGSAPLELIALR